MLVEVEAVLHLGDPHGEGAVLVGEGPEGVVGHWKVAVMR